MKIKNNVITIFFIFIFLFYPALLSAKSIIYFASLKEKSKNNKFVSSEVNFYPVKKSLNKDEFNEIHWTILVNQLDREKIIESGLRQLLLNKGTQFVEVETDKSKTGMVDDTVLTSYQGYFLDEIKFERIEKLKNGEIKIFFKTKFANVADPKQWSKIIFMDNLKSKFEYFKSFFR